MLNPKELSLLNVNRIKDKQLKTSGKTSEELIREELTRDVCAVLRMAELGIEIPQPEIDHELIEAASHPTGAGFKYLFRRSIPGAGVKQRSAVLIRVMASVAIEDDGLLWQHISLSRDDGKMPTYLDMVWVKEKFCPDSVALQIFPGRDEHVNDYPTCLHLFVCLEPDSFKLPDFRRHGTI